MIKPIIEKKTNFVLGARIKNGIFGMRKFNNNLIKSFIFNCSHILLTFLFNLFYKQKLKDPWTCYKVFQDRILKNIKFVKKVLPQDTLDYTKNLLRLKPDHVVHGDDWKFGIQKKTRKQVIKILKKWSGKLIEPKYTKNISSTKIRNKIDLIKIKKKFI